MSISKRLWIILSIVFHTLVSAQQISLTVYNSDIALVKDVRVLDLSKGLSTIAYKDVAGRIDPTSVHFTSLTSGDALAILEQNFEYDLVDARKVFTKYIDRQIRAVTVGGDLFGGVLLNADGNELVIENSDGGILVLRRDRIQHFQFPELPEGLITKPTLVWMVNNSGASRQKTELRYLTEGVNWHAEYVAVVDASDTELSLSGWVSLDNRSGMTYPDVKLKLVAGDVHRAEKRGRRIARTNELALAAADEPQFEERAFFEYHVYSLGRRTTLKDRQTKQLSLFPATRSTARKVYVYDGAVNGKKVRVNMEFENRKQEGLGLPLPAGTIRVYKADIDGALEFIGEDSIDHTPIDETVRILLGNAFDLTGERIRKSVKKIGDRAREETVEVILKNHKKEDVEIVIVEHIYGDWTVSRCSHSYNKKDAWTLEARIPVPAGQETLFNYTALIRW